MYSMKLLFVHFYPSMAGEKVLDPKSSLMSLSFAAGLRTWPEPFPIWNYFSSAMINSKMKRTTSSFGIVVAFKWYESNLLYNFCQYFLLRNASKFFPLSPKKQTKNPTHKHSCVGVTPFLAQKVFHGTISNQLQQQAFFSLHLSSCKQNK